MERQVNAQLAKGTMVPGLTSFLVVLSREYVERGRDGKMWVKDLSWFANEAEAWRSSFPDVLGDLT